MSQSVTEPEAPSGGTMRRVRDPRIWFSFAVTGVALWFALRGVDFGDVGRAMASADLLLLVGVSVPFHLAMLASRALRWRHLTGSSDPIARGTLYRGVAVGFMANNIFPLRMGELIRSWYVAREARTSSAAVFGTVIVERIVDAAVVAGLAAVILGLGGAAAAGMPARAVLLPVLLIAGVPLAGVVALRVAPDFAIGLLVRLLGRVLPERWMERLDGALRNLVRGLQGLRGGRSLAWVLFHSFVIWGLVSAPPFYVALLALGVDLGGTERMVAASYSVLMWVGVAVALPSAPGFFGPYHAACWVALRPFGVSKEVAVALGTLAHAVFWVTTTAAGLLVLRVRRTPLASIEAAAPDPDA